MYVRARHAAAAFAVLTTLACKEPASDAHATPPPPAGDASIGSTDVVADAATPSTANVVTPFVSALPRPPAADVAAVATSYAELGVDVYQQLASKKGPLLVSPTSLALALSMTAGGAKGDTAAEMAKTMHLASLVKDPKFDVHAADAALLADLGKPGSKDLELDVANRLFGQSGFAFAPSFLALTRDAYGAELGRLDFVGGGDAPRKEINEWAAAHTGRKIENLIGPGILDDSTRLVLADAVYFKGAWASPFRPELTKDAAFTNDDGKIVQVPTMHQNFTAKYRDVGDAELFDVPFAGADAGRAMELTVVLPKSTVALSKVEGELGQLPTWLGGMTYESLAVSLPRFSLSSSVDFADPLKALGMSRAFDENQADFSGIATVDKLHVSHVLQKTFMNVDEKGTEAAAATAVVMAVKGAAVEAVPMHVLSVDRPFVVVVRDAQSGSVLFLGRVVDPSK